MKDLAIKGEIYSEEKSRLVYATDASSYREKPVKVIWPRDKDDILQIIEYARKNGHTIIPRGAGTSLAGQVVGKGIVVDISRYMNKIIEFNREQKWVRVEPGIVLDELNLALSKEKLFFSPETSTSNRCVIGGMIGNNSSGLHSLVYGTTRDHLLSVKMILSDGAEVEFGRMNRKQFDEKCKLDTLEGKIYKHILELLAKKDNRNKILKEYPHEDIVRRNTGYALDELINTGFFDGVPDAEFNFCKLIAGSEGTLGFITEAKLNLVPLPPGSKALVCVHLNSVKDAIRANLVALKYNPTAVELMDQKILELTRKNREQQKNRFFLEGDPGALLMIEFCRDSMQEIIEVRDRMVEEMVEKKLGYHYPVVSGDDIKKVWNLRKSGLGVLSNMPGDARSVSVIEDTSVKPADLEQYIDDFQDILDKYQLECVYHAHISVGELHLRPVLNLKNEEHVKIFHDIALDTAKLVKRYKGSLSGEHGDGRLRGEFIPVMVGQEIYEWFRELKRKWDPDNLFNKGKITDTPAMNTFLRYSPGMKTPEIETIMDFSETDGLLRAAEKCNGSGDCRKTEIIGGTMCPSYMATRDEFATTRARANLLREYITAGGMKNPFNHPEVYEILDLCLSCKACKSECPSNVDMAKLKAEFLQHYYDKRGIPLRTRMIAYITSINKLGVMAPWLFNFFMRGPGVSRLIKRLSGFTVKRDLPSIARRSLHKFVSKNKSLINSNLSENCREVVLYVDEFTNYNDVKIGIKTISLLNRLGYKVLLPKAHESGRTFISKGLLRTAKKLAEKNVELFNKILQDDRVLVGVEPSAILSFRDEYPDLLRGENKQNAINVASRAMLLEEFVVAEFNAGRISRNQFTLNPLQIKVHGHCQQKAIASVKQTIEALTIPENYLAIEIPSGCCGMAGSFGYEKEHYDISMKVGELVLFPAVRDSKAEEIIVAAGTSCRHQIKDGTGRIAKHPAEVLYDALL